MASPTSPFDPYLRDGKRHSQTIPDFWTLPMPECRANVSRMKVQLSYCRCWATTHTVLGGATAGLTKGLMR